MDNLQSSPNNDWIIKVLLLGILITLILILLRIPAPLPTMGEFNEIKEISNKQKRKTLRNSLNNRIPTFNLNGGKLDDINSTIYVDINPNGRFKAPTVDVNILNEPISIEVTR